MRRRGGTTWSVVAVLALLVWTLLPDRSALARSVVSDAAFVVAPAVAAWCCALAARHRGPARRSWALLAMACAAWSLGSVHWSWTELVRGEQVGFPSWADAGYLAFPLLALPALALLPGLPARRATRLRLLLDGLVVGAALLLVAWLGALANLARGDEDLLHRAVALAFPVLDVLLASVVVVVLDRVRGGRQSPSFLAAIGVAGVAASDALYAVLAGGAGFGAGSPLDACWVASFLLLAHAAVRPEPVDDAAGGRLLPAVPVDAPVSGEGSRLLPAVPVDAPVSGEGSRLLPALPAGIAALALLLSGSLRTGLDDVGATLVLVLVAALAARQQLLAGENADLHRTLERKVAARTEALRRADEQAHRRATTDLLTGLPNREAFTEAVESAVPGAAEDALLAVVLLDLDGFKQVNDGFGHDAGDALLQAAAGRLTAALRDGQLLARLGGDEFAVLLTGLRHPTDALSVSQRLVDALASPLLVGPLEVVLGASVGTVVADSPDVEAVHLLRDADTAMYAAKDAGGGQVRAFSPDMHATVRARLEMEADLRVALRAGQLTVHYQPVVDLAADRVAGFEALARWTHPLRGPVPPADFVPAAERSGLVVELERLVLDLACAQLATWRRQQAGLTMAVNVSARHLREADYLDTVLATLHRHGLPPSALVLEVTESLLFHDDDSVRCVLERLHSTGIGLALDDFGTGFSSLSRLASYPFDTLKIDRAFVGALQGSGPAPVLTATLAMARGLGMVVVAEGVETPEQLAFLRSQGCELAQGYLLSRPGPALSVGGVIGRSLLPAPRTATDAPLTLP